MHATHWVKPADIYLNPIPKQESVDAWTREVEITLHFKKDSKRCCDTSMPKSIHTKDESKPRLLSSLL